MTRPRIVIAVTHTMHVTCNHRCCAERRLLAVLERQAHVQGGPRHSIAWFVRRSIGELHIERTTADGAAAICLPCVLCRKELDKYDIRWTAYNKDGETVTSDEAPKAQLTSRQRRDMQAR